MHEILIMKTWNAVEYFGILWIGVEYVSYFLGIGRALLSWKAKPCS